MGSLEWKCDDIGVYNPDINSKVFPVGTSDGATLDLVDSTILSVSDSFIMEN